MRVNARAEQYENAELFEKPVLFTDSRVSIVSRYLSTKLLIIICGNTSKED